MYRSLVVTGPTATGKTRLAVSLARRFGGEIVSADSRQVFRGLDIGTGKDLCEYTEGGEAVPYHLIDVAAPNEDFHLFRYLQLARRAIAEISARGRLPVVAGGTPLYIKALLDGYDQDGGAPDLAMREELERHALPELVEMLRKEACETLFQRSDLTQKRRVIRSLELARRGVSVVPEPIIGDSLILAPYYTRQEVHRRVAARLDARFEEGLLAEVQRLHEEGMSWERMEWLGLEYRFASRALGGKLEMCAMREELLAHIRQFCKRQDGWFRNLEREGKVIYWIPGGDQERAAELVGRWLEGKELPAPELRLDNIRYGKTEKGA